MKRQKTLLSPGGWTALLLLLALGLWEATAAAGYVDPFFFSRPSLLWQEFWTMLHSGMLARHLSVTAQEAGLGLLLGGTLGTLAGLGLGLSPRVSRALMPLMTGLNGLPKLALGPLFIIWFGMGLSSKVLISALMVFFIFAFNLYTGVQECGPRLGGGGAPAGRHPGTDPGKGHLARLPALAAHQSPHRSGPVPVRRHCGGISGLYPRHGLAPLRSGGCVQRPAGPLLRADPGDPHHPPGWRGPSVGSPPAALAMSPRSIVSALRL